MRLVTAVQALSLARTLEAVIEIVRKAARDIAHSDGATFILRDGDKCHYVDEDAIGPLWKGQRFPLSHCISGWTMLHRRPAVIPDIYEDARIPFDAYRPTFVKSLVMAPIRTDDPIGAIGIYWADPHFATDTEVELLQALANTTAVAMENVRLLTELEQRVEERTRQLAVANRELETFSYSVSHDLQAPLRHIKGYVEILKSEHLNAFDHQTQEYFKRIEGSTTRMGELIGDLLRLARFARVEMQSERVNLSDFARGFADELHKGSPTRAVEFKIQDTVEAAGDGSLLRIVLENLIGNAWKFTSKKEKAVIEFGSVLQPDGSNPYFVKDNGTGFNMQYAGRLFSPFQRLHGESEFEGNGIGLATVDKIVRRHGGRIWVEAAPEAGATFFFTLAGPAPGPKEG